jgi:hypothetical protein
MVLSLRCRYSFYSSCDQYHVLPCWTSCLRPLGFRWILVHQGDIFPELTKKQDDIKEILDEEEESFSHTLDRGEKLFDQYATRTKDQGAKELTSADVWRLYDTYGF